MTPIVVPISRNIEISIIQWIKKATTACFLERVTNPKFMAFNQGEIYWTTEKPYFAELVTPDEFKRRVKAACGKGGAEVSDIYVIVNRELRLELFRWLEKNTPVNMPNWGLRTRYIYFDGIDNINFLTRPSGKLVTPNEFRSRVKAACWKGER